MRNVQVQPRDVENGDDIVISGGVQFTVTGSKASVNGFMVFRNAANDAYVAPATSPVTIQIP